MLRGKFAVRLPSKREIQVVIPLKLDFKLISEYVNKVKAVTNLELIEVSFNQSPFKRYLKSYDQRIKVVHLTYLTPCQFSLSIIKGAKDPFKYVRELYDIMPTPKNILLNISKYLKKTFNIDLRVATLKAIARHTLVPTYLNLSSYRAELPSGKYLIGSIGEVEYLMNPRVEKRYRRLALALLKIGELVNLSKNRGLGLGTVVVKTTMS